MGEDGCKTFGFGPIVGVKVTQNDDSVFAAVRVAISVVFDGGDRHGREGFADNR